MLKYLEDFVEYIAGYRTATGNPTSYFTPTIRLANYDYSIVESLGRQTSNGTGYTDRQAALARKLVHKYRRQLTLTGISIEDDLPLRHSIRNVDRRRRINHDSDNNQLVIQFPFDNKLVDQLRALSNISCGHVVFDRDRRVWCVDASVPNTMWIWSWAQDHDFEVTFDINELVRKGEENHTRPQLTACGDHYCIEPPINSIDPGQLTDYDNNLLKLMSRAAVWQVDVNDSVLSRAETYPSQWIDWSRQRTPEIAYSQVSVEQLCDWLQALDLYPIWIHLPNLADVDGIFKNKFGEEQVSLGNKKSGDHKIYFVDSLNTMSKKIPPPRIIVTSQRIIYNIKLKYGNRADKIVYYGDNHLVDIRNQ